MRQIQVDKHEFCFGGFESRLGHGTIMDPLPTDVCYKYGQAERLFVLRDIEGRLYEHCLQANFQ